MTEPTTRAQLRAQQRRARLDTIITPTVRIWAYGVAIAAIPLAVWAGWIRPEAAPLILPLIMALLYVDKTGKPRT